MRTGPIAIGGVGGSGTRLIAQFLQDSGYYLGDDLNGSFDNLWYPVLFGRRDIFLVPASELESLFTLFFQQMSAPRPFTPDELATLSTLANQTRCQHSPKDMNAWAKTFIARGKNGSVKHHWGWKVPYNHVLIDRLFEFDDQLRYVHITRNGLDMAFSKNKNQLMTWGPVFLNRNVEPSPKDALSYWCAVHKRMEKIKALYPGRIFELSYDRLIHNPDLVLKELYSFLKIELTFEQLARFSSQIIVPGSYNRHLGANKSQFLPDDLSYAIKYSENGN